MHHDKSLTRMYYAGDLQVGRTCSLPKAQAHHALRVMRLTVGDPVVLFNGDGAEYTAVIAEASRDRFALDVTARTSADREAPLAITLAQAVSSGERMDYTVQKAVEMGVARIQPLITRRSVVRLDADRAARRVSHWQTVAIAACEQCGRNRVPPVAQVAALDDWLAGDASRDGGVSRFLLLPDAETRLREMGRPAAEILLLAGPEGGFDSAEEADARRSGFTAVRLGPRVLRTETAAVAALAAMQALWGDF